MEKQNQRELLEQKQQEIEQLKDKCKWLEWDKHQLIGCLTKQKLNVIYLQQGADVIEAVKAFNNSRHWWERKIKID